MNKSNPITGQQCSETARAYRGTDTVAWKKRNYSVTKQRSKRGQTV